MWPWPKSGLLLSVLGGVPLVPDFAAMQAREAVLGLAPDAMRRLGALAVLVTEDAERLGERLRLANAEQERLVAMGDGWWRVTPRDGEQAARASLYRLGPQQFLDRMVLAWARAPAAESDTAWRSLATLPQRWTAPAFPLKAADFIARGVAKGPALGAALRAAEAAWIAADFPRDADALARSPTRRRSEARR